MHVDFDMLVTFVCIFFLFMRFCVLFFESCVFFFTFFFFKQKTAYEMLISAWSSDVCSSDLSTQCVPVRPQILGGALGGPCRLTTCGPRGGLPTCRSWPTRACCPARERRRGGRCSSGSSPGPTRRATRQRGSSTAARPASRCSTCSPTRPAT